MAAAAAADCPLGLLPPRPVLGSGRPSAAQHLAPHQLAPHSAAAAARRRAASKTPSALAAPPRSWRRSSRSSLAFSAEAARRQLPLPARPLASRARQSPMSHLGSLPLLLHRRSQVRASLLQACPIPDLPCFSDLLFPTDAKFRQFSLPCPGRHPNCPTKPSALIACGWSCLAMVQLHIPWKGGIWPSGRQLPLKRAGYRSSRRRRRSAFDPAPAEGACP